MRTACHPILTAGKRALILGLFPLAIACVQKFQTLEPRELGPNAGFVRTPVKAHMYDGSIVVFRSGATVTDAVISGTGMRHAPDARAWPVTSVPLDSVVGVETFTVAMDPARTAGVSVLATAGAVVLGAAAAFAIFGSCPTFYADSQGTPVLQGEGFSYAIAPLFEHRDTDRLRLVPGPDGTVRLEVRNEALETHYINHLELLEVAHAADEIAITDERGRPVVLRALNQPRMVVNAAGSDVTAVLGAEDGDVYSTAPTFVATRTSRDLDDYLEFTVRAPAGSDSVAIVLRLRNSLLNTVLLYEEMLAAAGPRALDWMGQDLNRISTALELAEWYTRHMGMRVEVLDGGTNKLVSRIFDVGPIAFHDVVMVVPVGEHGSARVRLSFVADNWRIDRLAYSSDFHRTSARTVPLNGVYGVHGEAEPAALRSLSQPDDDYLVTSPGHRFMATFDAGTVASGARTFFLASQGYYIEWMRPEWLRRAAASEPFAPSADRIYSALTRWTAKREAFEHEFYASRIPMR